VIHSSKPQTAADDLANAFQESYYLPSRRPSMNDKPQTVHYRELPPAEPGSMIAREWDTYRREAGRLIAEGHEGRYVLIKADQILGLFATKEEAHAAGTTWFLLEPYLIQQVRTHEPLYHHVRYRSCPT
jgi:hypothetical protein